MAHEPYYAIYVCPSRVKEQQREAITESLLMSPSQQPNTSGYRILTHSCRDMTLSVIQGMNVPLRAWAADHNRYIPDLFKPSIDPEVFRLESNQMLWPARRHTAVAVPLHSCRVTVELLGRDDESDEGLEYTWDPNVVIHLNEVGLRFRGPGSLRFIYILFKVRPDPEGRRVTTPSRRKGSRTGWERIYFSKPKPKAKDDAAAPPPPPLTLQPQFNLNEALSEPSSELPESTSKVLLPSIKVYRPKIPDSLPPIDELPTE